MPEVAATPALVRRDLRVAAAILAIGVVAIAIGLAEDVTVLDRRTRWWHVLPLVVGCAAVAVQRRRPVLALVVGLGCLVVDSLLVWSLGTVLVAWEVLFTAAGGYPWPLVHALRRGMVGVTVAITLISGIVASDLRAAANAGLLASAVLIMPLWWGVDVRRQADLARFAEENAAHDRDNAVRAERARMARDLHDAVAGDLASIALHAEAGLRTTPPDHPAYAPLGTVRRASVRAVGELTTMITLLRRDAADEVVAPPGLDGLDDLVAHAESAGRRVHVEHDIDGPLPRAVDHAAYRIVQEALTNATRHGGAGDVRVTLVATDELLIDVVNDRAPGAGTDTTGGLGMLTMRERAEGLGGRFELGQSDETWRITARIPLQA